MRQYTIYSVSTSVYAVVVVIVTTVYDLIPPTVPEMEPSPILPDEGAATVDQKEVNLCEYGDCVVTVCPTVLVPVTQIKVGEAEDDDDDEDDDSVVVASTVAAQTRTRKTFNIFSKFERLSGFSSA